MRPIQGLIGDDRVSEIMVNGSSAVFVEREGRIKRDAHVQIGERNLQVATRNIARALGDETPMARGSPFSCRLARSAGPP